MRSHPVADAFSDTEIEQRFGHLGRVTPLPALGFVRQDMLAEDMGLIAEQALELLSSYYVHLPLKRSLYAVDPQQRLRILMKRIADGDAQPPIDEDEFHAEMASIFSSLRDLHTTYTLPEPHRSRIAFLPFLLEECDDGRGPVFPLTKVCGTFSDPDFAPSGLDAEGPPVVVTHWNGVPIGRAVDLHGERTGGSNREARRARGVERLTFRWMGRLARPDEHWVTVTYEVGGERRDLRFPWLVVERDAAAVEPPASRRSFARGLDHEGEWIRRVKQELYARPEQWESMPFGDLVAYRPATRPDDPDEYGYLRLFSFGIDPGQVGRYLATVRRLLRAAPPTGLIIDIRGNPGGDIVAAERLLQLLSPAPIEPEPLDFINTPPANGLAERFHRARGDATTFKSVRREAASTAAPFIPSLPYEPLERYNDFGQVYQGPVVLLVDALSFSAADIFAAGFQDHRLGTVIGTDRQTGGGGANVWPYESIRRFGDRSMPKRLPHDATFDVAVRRTTRVAGRAGVTLEDRGVLADGEPVPLTSKDVLGSNDALIEAAIGRLDPPPAPYALRAAYHGSARRFELHAPNLGRVDVYLDQRLFVSLRDPDGARIELPADGETPAGARFVGYVSDDPGARPVVSCRWSARRSRTGVQTA